MYKCQKCGQVTNPGEKLNKIVTKVRDRRYINVMIDKKSGLPLRDRNGIVVEKITNGKEVVEEKNLCAKCYSSTKNYFFDKKEVRELKKEFKKENKNNFNKFDKKDFKNNNQEEKQEKKYLNSNYQGKNFDPDYYKKKYANQGQKRD